MAGVDVEGAVFFDILQVSPIMPLHRFILVMGLFLLVLLCRAWLDSDRNGTLVRYTSGNDVHYVGLANLSLVHATVKEGLATGPAIPRGATFIRDRVDRIDPHYQVFIIECALCGRITDVRTQSVGISGMFVVCALVLPGLVFAVRRRDERLRLRELSAPDAP